ncbi:MAG: ASKHA domain-containing protein [Candidatus Binatia bacterium]
MSKEELLGKLAKTIIDGDEQGAGEVAEEIILVGINPLEAIKQGATKGLDELGVPLGYPYSAHSKGCSGVQLARAAFRAGVRTIMQHMGVKQVERVVLAGALGSYLDPKSALAIGMLPPCDPERIISVGNAAGTGARMALLSKSQRAEAANVVLRVNYLELTAQPDFGSTFLDELTF